jgi:hypothetical protein
MHQRYARVEIVEMESTRRTFLSRTRNLVRRIYLTGQSFGGVVQEYVQTFVCVCDRRKMVYPMLGLWMEAGNSDFLPRRCSRGGVSVLDSGDS